MAYWFLTPDLLIYHFYTPWAHLPGDDTAHSDQDPPLSINNQENASQTYL